MAAQEILVLLVAVRIRLPQQTSEKATNAASVCLRRRLQALAKAEQGLLEQ